MNPDWKAALIEAVPSTVAYDLACIGTSISGFGAMTIESVGYLVSADVVFSHPVSTAHDVFLRGFNSNIIDLDGELYTVGRLRSEAYRSIIDLIMAELHAGKRVCYAQQGSPAFLAYTGIELRRTAAAAGFKLVVAPGVSSFECLLTYLGARHDLYDVQLINCGTLVDLPISHSRELSLLLFNLVTYADDRVTRQASALRAERLKALERRLISMFGAEQHIHLLSVLPGGRVDERIAKLDDFAPLLHTGPSSISLFLPAAEPKA